MDMKKLVEAIAPPQDCATCEHLDLEQTMPLTEPPIPIAYCHIACGDDEEVTYSEQAAEFWAGNVERCDSHKESQTREQLKARITELEEKIKGMDRECNDCDYWDDGDHEPTYNEGMD